MFPVLAEDPSRQTDGVALVRQALRAERVGMMLTLVAALAGGWAIVGEFLATLSATVAGASAMAGLFLWLWVAPCIRKTGDTRMRLEVELRELKATAQRLERELERKDAEAAATARRVEAATAAKDNFLAMMSHEIRTPINGVLDMTSLLMTTKLDEEQRKYAEAIQKSGEVLIAIIDDLLDFSKLEAGKLRLRREPFSPKSVVAETVSLYQGVARERGLNLQFRVDPAVPGVILGDQMRVRQILGNLIDNALKFTSAGGMLIEVLPHASPDTPPPGPVRAIRFSVRDSGAGISEDVARTLFQPFEQGDFEHARKYGGTGLGLAICRQLVELMGGKICATSAEEGGSVFVFWIPTASEWRSHGAGTATLRRDA
jgi:signal transduction histidine kinase